MCKLLKKLRKGTKGQALAELLIMVPVYAIILCGINFFSRWLYSEIKLNMAVRTAVWQCVYDNKPASEMRSKAETLAKQIPFIDKDTISISVNEGRSYSGAAHVQIDVKLPVPRYLRAAGFPDNIDLSARNEVYNDSWIMYPMSNLSHS